MSTKLPSRPKLPSLPRIPSRTKAPAPVEMARPETREQETDEYGLSAEMVETMSPLARQYLARCMEFVGLNKRESPTRQGFGTIPECVLFGGLLERGFTFGNAGPQSFEYQSKLLGGRRVPGGTVIDVLIYSGNRRIAVYVDSIFHSLENPFGGLSKIYTDDARFIRALGAPSIDALVRVNRGSAGYPLENGPDAVILHEFDRMLHAR